MRFLAGRRIVAEGTPLEGKFGNDAVDGLQVILVEAIVGLHSPVNPEP